MQILEHDFQHLHIQFLTLFLLSLEDILLYAPRILNERTCCKSSRFKKIEALIILDKRLLNSNGVTLAKPFNLLAAISTPCKEG